jgi:hypothetical protein
MIEYVIERDAGGMLWLVEPVSNLRIYLEHGIRLTIQAITLPNLFDDPRCVMTTPPPAPPRA